MNRIDVVRTVLTEMSKRIRPYGIRCMVGDKTWQRLVVALASDDSTIQSAPELIDALIQAADCILIGHHRDDDERDIADVETATILSTTLAQALDYANEARMHQKWQRLMHHQEYNPGLASQYFNRYQISERQLLWVAGHQYGVYRMSITEATNVTTVYYLATAEMVSKLWLQIREEGVRDITLRSLAMHGIFAHCAVAYPNENFAVALEHVQVPDLLAMVSNFKEQSLRKYGSERDILTVTDCKHVPEEHTSECYHLMADSLDYISDWLTPTRLLFTRHHQAEALRQAADTPISVSSVSLLKSLNGYWLEES